MPSIVQSSCQCKPVARRYVLTFDGSTKTKEVVADYVTAPNAAHPGLFTFSRRGAFVGTFRYVATIEAHDIPPSVEELQAEIALLKGQLNVATERNIAIATSTTSLIRNNRLGADSVVSLCNALEQIVELLEGKPTKADVSVALACAKTTYAHAVDVAQRLA